LVSIRLILLAEMPSAAPTVAQLCPDRARNRRSSPATRRDRADGRPRDMRTPPRGHCSVMQSQWTVKATANGDQITLAPEQLEPLVRRLDCINYDLAFPND
jgi:hypothetical protein